MKKVITIFLVLIIFIAGGFSYIQYKKSDVEESVIDYLTTKENVVWDDIVSSEPFISNLKGDKNWMVSIKLKNDDNTYFYYKTDNKIILESYVKDGVEFVQ